MWKVCPKCNHLNSDDSKRCERCRYRFPQSEQPTEEQWWISKPQPQPTPDETTHPQDLPGVSYERKSVTYSPWEPGPTRELQMFLNRWFGPNLSDYQRRENMAHFANVIIGFVVLVAVLTFAILGAFCNSALWLVGGILLFWVVHNLRELKWSGVAAAVVIAFVILPILIIGLLPW